MAQKIKTEHDSSLKGGVFYLVEGGERIAHLTYRKPSSSQYVITYVEVDPSHRGRGFAKRLVKEMVDFRDEKSADLEATCGVAHGILQKMGEL